MTRNITTWLNFATMARIEDRIGVRLLLRSSFIERQLPW
jgi:hypothetical protein